MEVAHDVAAAERFVFRKKPSYQLSAYHLGSIRTLLSLSTAVGRHATAKPIITSAALLTRQQEECWQWFVSYLNKAQLGPNGQCLQLPGSDE